MHNTNRDKINIAILAVFIVLFARSLTTFFHELGHAVPALFFTEEAVNVYIGTYGDISKGMQTRIGRLQLFCRLNLFDWKLRMCSFVPCSTPWKSFLILLGGPIASLLISIPLLLIILNYDLSETGYIFIAVFILASFVDFVVNLYPSSKPIPMHDGSVSYCDGYQVLHLFLRRFLSKEYLALEGLFFSRKISRSYWSGGRSDKKQSQRFICLYFGYLGLFFRRTIWGWPLAKIPLKNSEFYI